MGTRLPVVAMSGHLMWTRTGTVWATWRLEGLAKGFGSSDTAKWSRLIHQDLFQSIHGEYMLLGLTADLDPASVVNRMLDGVDIEAHPAWALEAMLTMDSLADRPLGKREFWLAAPLRMGNVKNQVGSLSRTVETSLRDMLALPLNPPSSKEILAALQAAGKIEEQLPAKLNPRRASVAEQVWIATHSQTRGLGLGTAAPDASGSALGGVAEQYGAAEGSEHVAGPGVFPNPLVDEGGQSDVAGKAARFDPFSRRYVKIQNLREETSSYQVLMALSGTPKGGWETPTVDWVGRIDELGVDADWVIRLNVVPARDATRRNRRAETNIEDQLDQQDGTAAITGSGGALVQTALTLQQYHAELNRSEKEVEVQATMVLAVAGPTADEARSRAQFLQKDFKGIDFTFDIPLGAQEALWWSMQPGVPTSRQVREFIEITTGAMFATLVPLSSSELGDRKGLSFATNITSGTEQPVLLDLEGQAEADISGSVGMVGEQGGGKSTAMKVILGAVHDRGGQIVMIDRTGTREYATFAASLNPEDTVVCDVVDAQYSLDPLRLFGPHVGATHVLTLMTALLGVDVLSDIGATLAEVLDADYAAAHQLTDLGRLHAHLQELGKTDADARSIAKRMTLYIGKQFGRVLFDSDLPVLDLTKSGIAFLTNGLALPSKYQLEQDKIPYREAFGRAMYALMTSISRHICFADKSRLSVFAADEVHHITMSPEGDQEMDSWYREGRKYKASVIAASQDAPSLGKNRGQIKNRLVFRQTDDDLAAANLEWFNKGLGTDEDMIDTVTSDLSPLSADGTVPDNRRGEALFRDAQRRMGKIRVQLPQVPERRMAVLSTPSKAAPSKPTPAEEVVAS